MNITDVIVVGVLALAVALVLVKMHRDKKAGRSACGCGGSCGGSCSGCPMSTLEQSCCKRRDDSIQK